MPKLVSLHQEMIVEKLIQEFRVGGTVVKSNFIEEGTEQAFPIDLKVIKNLKIGDRLKISFFTNAEDIRQTENSLAFKGKGVRYEVWNKKSGGWDKIFEEYPANPV